MAVSHRILFWWEFTNAKKNREKMENNGFTVSHQN
jgi:hypothetical protein